ncbi:Putative PLC-like phosphodiesterase, TIM beta/alpha-barrel domain superfamily [Colletotrichum destructivum]|uniref:PLC-like phosphodiesterase, TIM beta/alpha-barrel domain superfamily n=1 Tax=Colletotrichum destructivum TaxID=34406 RepID=A0AAX4IZL0_9PEZI|nr:Putative PLC-like phosphodiesterase, TIM beta/alpha-barrel domain superfamily [Colletotrichum destructivum]
MAGRLLPLTLGLLSLITTPAVAQDGSTSHITLSNTEDVTFLSGTRTIPVTQPRTPTGPYATYTSRITLTNGDLSTMTGTMTFTGNVTQTTTNSVGQSVVIISGQTSVVTSTVTGNSTQTTTSAAGPTNTQPCNNYVEFCDRKYSNITEVGCHNSPFVRPGNSASNQALDVTTQLNDGVRFLQAQIQWPTNGTKPHFCHSSCDILDVGPITEWLTTVREWVAAHPYDVVTILLGNGNYSTPDLYAPFIESTGILQYAYEPPFLPMTVEDWPTLSQMILGGKRVVMFLDYMADQQKFPWLLDQFSQMWESPFDPMDRTFPCTVQRPPDLPDEAARDRLYLMNHNLNAEYNIFGASILVPAVSLLNETNNVTGYGSLGVSAQQCTDQWDRPPKILNVDYYNYGGYPGSVFEVQARMNNVTYTRDCCGKVTGASPGRPAASAMVLGMALACALLLV